MNLISQKMGISEWSYHNDYNPVESPEDEACGSGRALPASSTSKWSWASIAEQTAREVQRCLNCDIETTFSEKRCIECDACVDICPVQCLTITRDGDEADLRTRLSAPADEPDQAIYASDRCRKPGASWSKTKICASTAACAPSDVLRRRGTCKSSISIFLTQEPHARRPPYPRKRFRRQAGECQWDRLRQRQRPADAGHLPHGHSRIAARICFRRTFKAFPPGTRFASIRTATRRARWITT